MKSLKPAYDIQQQIDCLKDKGISITNEEYAKRILKRISYYRLLGYILPVKKNLKKGDKITFYNIVHILMFDQQLRNVILRYIEHVEISLRTFISNVIAFEGNADGMSYTDAKYFKNISHHKDWLKQVLDNAGMSDELFMVHYKNNYDSNFPIWVLLEILSIGKVSRLYDILKNDLQKKIAASYTHIHYKRLTGYLKSISYLRNKCAHHSRIYDRVFKKILPDKWYKEKNLDPSNISDRKLFSQLLILKDLCVDNGVWKVFFKDFTNLLNQYKKYIDIKCLGMPDNWESTLK